MRSTLLILFCFACSFNLMARDPVDRGPDAAPDAVPGTAPELVVEPDVTEDLPVKDPAQQPIESQPDATAEGVPVTKLERPPLPPFVDLEMDTALLTELTEFEVIEGEEAAVDSMSVPIVDYRIIAKLDHKKKTINGQQTLIYTNHSPDTIPYLRFHTYLNAFKNQRSTFWRESGGMLRSDRAEKDWGFIDIVRMQINGQDVTSTLNHVQPDGTDPDDQTVLHVPLNEPVAAGQSIQIDVEFISKLPRVFARTGFYRNYFLVGQWFPKIGVWESAGTRGRTESGWNCHQFHAHSEFYADYGNYSVSITVPKDFVVGATGVQTRRDELGDEVTYTFEQNRVHDFAFAASPDFIREERIFHAQDWVTQTELDQCMQRYGIDRSEAQLNDVTMILLLQKNHKHLADRYFDALANGIKHMGLMFGAYPYPTITCIDPAWGARGSGGMEYPTFITGGANRFQPDDEWTPEHVTVHEFAHQYWYGMVGSNEFEESWLDEGFTTFSTTEIMDRVYGPSAAYHRLNGIPIQMNGILDLAPRTARQLDHIGVTVDQGADAIVRKAWQYRSSISYGLNSYYKASATLHQLSHELGEDVFLSAMRVYFQRWQYRHPTTADFRRVLEEVSGRDLTWFFDQFIFGSRYVDFAVARVDSEETGNELGYIESDQGRTLVDKAPPKSGRFRHVVEVENKGDGHYPVTVRFTFSDGQVVEEKWAGDYDWERWTFDDMPQLDKVEVDPEHNVFFDANRINNGYQRESQYLPSLRWSAKALLWAQTLLQALTGGL